MQNPLRNPLLTPRLVPADVHLKMLRLHAPEELGLSKNYIDEPEKSKEGIEH